MKIQQLTIQKKRDKEAKRVPEQVLDSDDPDRYVNMKDIFKKAEIRRWGKPKE